MILYWTDLFVSVKQLQVVSIKKKALLKISQNLQKNTYARVSILIKLLA